jgi:hypothetical protein
MRHRAGLPIAGGFAPLRLVAPLPGIIAREIIRISAIHDNKYLQ